MPRSFQELKQHVSEQIINDPKFKNKRIVKKLADCMSAIEASGDGDSSKLFRLLQALDVCMRGTTEGRYRVLSIFTDAKEYQSSLRSRLVRIPIGTNIYSGMKSNTYSDVARTPIPVLAEHVAKRHEY